MSQGKILLVSLGPGAAEHMSLRARQAITEAEVVIGYSTYIKLLQGQGLLEGKESIRSPMTEEIGRCVQACELARSGKVVALVSSGDIGVYGMAGPTYEVLLQSGWMPGEGIAVEIVPGSTALSTCASLVGAPLTHDFCSISLSDLLTPWPVIAKRIEAAARADFVIALYNPKSGRRTGQIAEAQRILLNHRRPDTPVAIVKSAYREAQHIQRLRLDELLDGEIGMLSTVLIGNSSSYYQAGLMITPRGYANKYADLTGDAKAGEKAGRSLSMGLEGWKACVGHYLQAYPDRTLDEVAQHFAMPLGDVLSALAEADSPGTHVAAPVRESSEMIFAAARQWGAVRLVLRNGGGSASRCWPDGIEFCQRGDSFHFENEHGHWQIDGKQLRQTWFVRQGEQLRTIHFLDASGHACCELSLVSVNGQLDQSAVQRFDKLCQMLTALNTP